MSTVPQDDAALAGDASAEAIPAWRPRAIPAWRPRAIPAWRPSVTGWPGRCAIPGCSWP